MQEFLVYCFRFNDLCMTFICCSSSLNDCEIEWSDIGDITMATADSATHVDSMDADDNCRSSMVTASGSDDIQHCLQRLLALG